MALAEQAEANAELAYERSNNERYLAEHDRTLRDVREIRVQTGGRRNGIWLGTIENRIPIARGVEPLAGRVALDLDDPLLGTSFYIGNWHHEWPGVCVVSWATPMARLFYMTEPDRELDLVDNVVARRTFTPHGRDLISFEDEITRPEASGSQPFRPSTGGALKVRPAPSPGRRPSEPARRRPTISAEPAGSAMRSPQERDAKLGSAPPETSHTSRRPPSLTSGPQRSRPSPPTRLPASRNLTSPFGPLTQ